MTRTPLEPPPTFVPPDQDVVLTLSLRTITPLFDGVSTARQNDALMPVHDASIHEALRHWWRVARAGDFETIERLYAQEAVLWGESSRGEAAGQSPIGIVVRNVTVGERRRCAAYRRNAQGKYRSLPDFVPGWPRYALLPFQGKATPTRIDEDPTEALLNVQFTLEVTFSEVLRTDVETALGTWIRFGGLGSRTRRGCGSLEIIRGTLPPITCTEGRNLPEVTQLPQSYHRQPEIFRDPIEAWAEAVELYAYFRNGEGFGQQQDSGNMLGMSNAFPCADFGLPIIFPFKSTEVGAPGDNMLGGPTDDKTRLASPVLTKAIPNGRGGYYAALLVLTAPAAAEPQFRVDGKTTHQRLHQLAKDEGWQGVRIGRVATYSL